MWYIKIKNKQKETLIKSVFKTKQDAFNYMRANRYIASDVVLINGDIDLISDDIQVESLLKVNREDSVFDYGTIDEITNYLVLIKKVDGSIMEFTKGRINKEYVKGVFLIQKAS